MLCVYAYKFCVYAYTHFVSTMNIHWILYMLCIAQQIWEEEQGGGWDKGQVGVTYIIIVLNYICKVSLIFWQCMLLGAAGCICQWNVISKYICTSICNIVPESGHVLCSRNSITPNTQIHLYQYTEYTWSVQNNTHKIQDLTCCTQWIKAPLTNHGSLCVSEFVDAEVASLSPSSPPPPPLHYPAGCLLV